ncbi:Agmatinase [Klebsiella pneumoniae]|uniref:Agmatinase n=1 Tax=Klebsiella pneumoniae TaxID=573 RepID=A0A2X3F3H1_KLEPN|nr:Agmatinase [Klebsiella pneumoniae]
MDNLFHQPQGGNEMPRFAGRATMMRLPFIEDLQGLDAAFVGIPLDIGTSQRSGTRYGPRYIRAESVMIRPYNMATGAAPFDSLSVADIGDVPINTYSLLKSVQIIEDYYTGLNSYPLIPLTLGGDHTITLPILRGADQKTWSGGGSSTSTPIPTPMMRCSERKSPTAPPSRRAVEEGLLDLKRVVQIGQRAQGYAAGDFQWGVDQGFRLVQAEQCWHTSLAPLMAEVRQQMGNGPVYLSFDIDSLDPIWAPGTGTPEVGGLSSIQALEIVRGCRGLNLIGADLVEVSPPYDVSGNTSQLAANLLYEMLCVLPGVKYA